MSKIRRALPCIGLFLLVFLFSGCQTSKELSTEGGSLKITSAAFKEGTPIPKKYTCDDKDISPPLSWTGVPKEAKSLTLIVDDPDALLSDWVHWVLFDMEPTLKGLPEGIIKEISTTGVGVQGVSDFGKIGYGGPCPPEGKTHHYYFRLYALDTRLSIQPGITRSEVDDAMKGHILATGQLIGTYGR